MSGGPAYEPAGRRGASALYANLLTKDTRRRGAAAVAQFIEEVGGSFYPFVGNSSLGLAVEGGLEVADGVLGGRFGGGQMRLEAAPHFLSGSVVHHSAPRAAGDRISGARRVLMSRPQKGDWPNAH